MKDKIKIAVVNFKSNWGNKELNLENIKKYCKKAGQNGVNLIVFPETCLTGYDNEKDKKHNEKMQVKLAETIPGKSTNELSELAKEYNMFILFGMPERKSPKSKIVYNSAAIISPDGESSSYRKIHLPFDEREWAEPFDKPVMIKSEWGNIGITICYDTYCFPEIIRYYRSQGARLVLNLTACPNIPCTMAAAKTSLPAYACINYVYIASSNLCGKDKFNIFPGGSSVIGPDNTDKGYKVFLGKFFGEKGADKENIYIGEIDLSLADKNADIPIFKGDWQPKLYSKWIR